MTRHLQLVPVPMVLISSPLCWIEVVHTVVIKVCRPYCAIGAEQDLSHALSLVKLAQFTPTSVPQ